MAVFFYPQRQMILPVWETKVIQYPFATVNLHDFMSAHRTYIRAYPNFQWVQKLQPLKVWLESPDYQVKIHQLFLQADRDGNGCLDWNNGEIRNFIRSAYEFHGLPDPSPLDDGHAFQLFQRFDADRSGSLDVRECLALVDTMFRATLHAYGNWNAYPSLLSGGTALTLKAHGQNGSQFAVKDRVQVFSNRSAAWRMAEVVGVHSDGRCDVKYVDAATDAYTGEDKTIPLDQQASLMRGFR